MAKKAGKKENSGKKSNIKLRRKTPPKWLVFFSNKILPPIFFLFIALISLYFISEAEPLPLKINLGAVSVTSSGLSMYIASLMM